MLENATPLCVNATQIETDDTGSIFLDIQFFCYPNVIIHRSTIYPSLPVQNWMSAKRMKTLGIPTYIGSGCLEKNGKRYRFMVMERFGTDIHKVFEQHGRKFSPKTVFTIALKLVSQ